jgi:aromatic-L-amino-acid decarboxylase
MGLSRFALSATPGTVNTGTIDPLAEIGNHRERRKYVWFHIDGAFGALAKLVPAYQSPN